MMLKQLASSINQRFHTFKEKLRVEPIERSDHPGRAYSQDDLEYMQSLSSAVLQKAPLQPTVILWVAFGVIAWLLIWSSFAQIDELTRGSGKVIPSHQIQIVQNLEGGIVSELHTHEGEIVSKGQVLLKIDDTKFTATYQEAKLRYFELKAKAARLEAEAEGKPFEVDEQMLKEHPKPVAQERSLYKSRQSQLQQTIGILKEQLHQRENELKEAIAKEDQLKKSYALIEKEIAITEPLAKKGLVSEVEFLQLQRQGNAMYSELQTVSLSIPRINSTISESRTKIKEARLEFQNRAKAELNEAVAEMDRLIQSKLAIEDQVKRTMVRSPVEGIVKQLLVNTVGGVVQPGMDLVEIVPLEDTLLVEAKVRPSDIAFLYPGQKAIVKFTAYDFAIHGGLEGKLTHISADTMTDDEGNSFFLVRIKTDKNFLGSEESPLRIMVGMTAEVDIMTGKKTVLDYILKPIIKAQSSALRER